MVLSNAEKQRAWRERHIRERRAVRAFCFGGAAAT
jgi:hypothetical protein